MVFVLWDLLFEISISSTTPLTGTMPLQELKDMPHILLRFMFIGIVAALRQHGKLSFGKMMVEGCALLHVKEKAPVR